MFLHLKHGLLLLIACASTCLLQAQPVPVFTAGTEGYSSYRIPAIVSLRNGTLLAFCEGRVANAGDFGNVDIVLKRSTDGGRTWSALQLVVNNDSLQAGNPAPVLDHFSEGNPQGRLFLFYNTGNASEHAVREGKGVREVWYITSTDGGLSWSTPVNITTQVHRPYQPQANSAYTFKEDWRSYANTPGHAMQFTRGRYKGRIYVAANHSSGPPRPQFEEYQSHGFYTDDGGRTFHLGATVPVRGSNEATAALTHNRLMLNARNQKGDVRARIVAISSDGGATWDTAFFEKNLIDPVNEGSLLTLRQNRRHNTLAFCNAADTTQRNHLTLRLSFDDGRTWPRTYPVDASSTQPDFTAYSDLVKISHKRVGILYERDNYRQIVFRVVRWRH